MGKIQTIDERACVHEPRMIYFSPLSVKNPSKIRLPACKHNYQHIVYMRYFKIIGCSTMMRIGKDMPVFHLNLQNIRSKEYR